MVQSRTRACTAVAALFLAVQAPAQQNVPPQGPNDPNLWLEEVYGGKPMDWVNKENERTLTRMLSDQGFAANYRLALKEMSSAEGSGPVSYQIYDGKIYGDAFEGRRRLLERADLRAFLDGKPQWKTVFDDSMQPVEDGKLRRYLPPVLAQACKASRCMFLYAIKGEKGKEWASELREFDLDRGRFVADGFVVTSDTPAYASWQDRDTLLLAKDWGNPGDLAGSTPTTLKQWRRGSPIPSAADEAVYRGGSGVIVATVRNEHGLTLLMSASGDATAQSYSVIRKNSSQKTILPLRSSIQAYSGEQVVFNIDEPWSFVGQHHPAGALLSVDADELTSAHARIHIVKTPGPRQGYLFAHGTKRGLLVTYLDNVRGRLSRFDWDGRGWRETPIAVPDNVTVNVSASDPTATAVLVGIDRFDEPELYLLDMRTGTLSGLSKAGARAEPSGIVVEQRETPSADGTRIPYFIVRRGDVPADGDRPTLLNGYGALGAPRLPEYKAVLNRLWIRRGGVYVLANIRGGGEFAGWHVMGMERKHVYEDFIAVAQDIIGSKLTSPRHLGIQGHSNGGLLVGATLNLRPELFGAAVMLNPVLDIWAHVGGVDTDEYGAWSKPDERAYLLSESPYHALRPNKDFVVPLVMTSTNDNAFPKATRKYVAKLRSFGQDVFYYEQPEGEHECGPTIEQCALRDAMVYTYLSARLGLSGHTSQSEDAQADTVGHSR